MNSTSSQAEWGNISDIDDTGLQSLYNSSSPLLNTTEVEVPVSFLGFILTIRGILSILAIVGNGLTIYAIIRFASLQTNTNYLVASLAVADLIQGLLAPFVILHHLLVNTSSFVPICLVEKTFSAISARANFINILWISIDRFFYIAYPLRYPLWQTNNKTFTLIGITWLYITVDTSLVMYFGNVLKPGGICKLSLVVQSTIFNFYFTAQMFVALFITIICYIAIARIAYKQGKAIAVLHQPFETLEVSIHNKQKKIAKMMFTVLASYIISYLPQSGITILIQNKKTLLTIAMERVTTLIFYSNSFINPIIYAWKSKEFKVAFKKILGIKNEITVSGNNGVMPEGAQQ